MQQITGYNAGLYKGICENYKELKLLCATAEKEGYCSEAEQLLNVTVEKTLPLFIQAILLSFCIETGRLDRKHIRLIQEITEADVEESTVKMAERIYHAPPILLQLCTLRDAKKQSAMGSSFFDSALSILIAFSSMDGAKNQKAILFIANFYNRMIPFIEKEQVHTIVSKRYFFKKISEEPFVEEKRIKTPENNAKLEQLLEELHRLIGLEAVKQQITTLVNLVKVRKVREEYGMPQREMSYHMVFTGNPGTGKTTVARLIAKIYHELGILKTGTFIETDRSGLVAGYVGQTALKVKEVVESALGGVLFIDEAYSLTSSNLSGDYSKEAVEVLVKEMEDHRDELLVIVAGYKEEMGEFLNSNPGLHSRFNTVIEFEDYSDEELIRILQLLVNESGMQIKKEAIEAVRDTLQQMSKEERSQFGNARGIRNLFEKILMKQANRVILKNDLSKSAVSIIEKEDVST